MKTLKYTLILFASLLATTTQAQLFTEQTDIVIPGIIDCSLDWGDYNNDGLLDFMLTGDSANGYYYYSAIYENIGNNDFIEHTEILESVDDSDMDWGDYNNDNYLDIILAGENISNNTFYVYTNIYRNNRNGSFTLQSAMLQDETTEGSVRWGEFSNDGYADIFQSGNNGYWYITKVYKNNKNNSFSPLTNINIEGVIRGSVAWGDYNNDSLLDFIFTGWVDGVEYTTIYKNIGNDNFLAQEQILIKPYTFGSVRWGDYNNDGFLDILVAGEGTSNTFAVKIYKNNKGESFAELENTNFVGVSQGHTIFGDYNNDGLLDVLITGWDSSKKDQTQTKLYENKGNDIFFEQANTFFTPVGSADVTFGDYDNDNDLDILLSGVYASNSYCTKIYKNNATTPNIKPNVITGLQTEIKGDTVFFSWNEATDDNQPSGGLSYNIYVYQEDNPLPYVATPQAFPQTHPLNGKRTLAQRGHIQGIRENGRVAYFLKGVFQNCKTYKWSVQAIDASFAGGKFAPEVSFVFDNIAPQITCPENLSIEIPQDQTTYTVTNTDLDPVNFSDNCGTVTLTNSYNNTATLQGEELYLGTTEITWTATDAVGNTTECETQIEIKQATTVQNIVNEKFTIQPNPTKGIFTVKSHISNLISHISITDITGKQIYRKDALHASQATQAHTSQTVTLDLSNNPKGIYFITISNKQYAETKKLIIY